MHVHVLWQLFDIHFQSSYKYVIAHAGYKWTLYMYSSAAINIDVNGRVCGVLVQFGCYQHRHK